MTETERRVDAVMAVLKTLRAEQLLPADAPISPAGMAYVSEVIGLPVSKSTFIRLQRQAILAARAHAHLRELDTRHSS